MNAGNIFRKSATDMSPEAASFIGSDGSVVMSPMPSIPSAFRSVPAGVLTSKRRKYMPVESMANVPFASRRTPQRSVALSVSGREIVVA